MVRRRGRAGNLANVTTHPFGAESEQGKEVGHIHKALGFALLGIGEGLPAVLLIE